MSTTIEKMPDLEEIPVPGLLPRLARAIACPVCGSGREHWQKDAETYGSGPYERDTFTIFRCDICTAGITDPVPSAEDSRLLYEERTSSDFQPGDGGITSSLKQWAAERDVRAFFDTETLNNADFKLLDYACGNGAFALAMSRRSRGATVWATDYHQERPGMLLDSGVRYVSYDGLHTGGPFDVILCRHVMEHTYEPAEFLKTVGELLAPNGMVILEVPNLKAPLRSIFGKYWDNYYVPFHPVHFSKEALRRAVADAGMIVEREGSAEMPKIGRSLRNIFGGTYNLFLFAVGMALQPLQSLAAVFTSEPTCLRVWVRKL